MAKPRKRGKPKGGQQPGGMLKEAIVLLPLTYNDGTRVAKGTLESIYGEIFAAFHGWTIEGTVRGAYRMRTGQKRVEALQKVSIVLDESQVPDLEAMVGKWAAVLGQEAMLLKVSDHVIKFIPPRREAEES
jgi:hypothetical protein